MPFSRLGLFSLSFFPLPSLLLSYAAGRTWSEGQGRGVVAMQVVPPPTFPFPLSKRSGDGQRKEQLCLRFFPLPQRPHSAIKEFDNWDKDGLPFFFPLFFFSSAFLAIGEEWQRRSLFFLLSPPCCSKEDDDQQPFRRSARLSFISFPPSFFSPPPPPILNVSMDAVSALAGCS